MNLTRRTRGMSMLLFFQTPKGCILSLRKRFVMSLTSRTRGMSMFFSDTERLYTIATQTVCNEFNKPYKWDVNVFFRHRKVVYYRYANGL